jgi:peptide subunit release factor 1 (eRF1)
VTTTTNICNECGWEGDDDELVWKTSHSPSGVASDIGVCPDCGNAHLEEEERELSSDEIKELLGEQRMEEERGS